MEESWFFQINGDNAWGTFVHHLGDKVLKMLSWWQVNGQLMNNNYFWFLFHFALPSFFSSHSFDNLKIMGKMLCSRYFHYFTDDFSSCFKSILPQQTIHFLKKDEINNGMTYEFWTVFEKMRLKSQMFDIYRHNLLKIYHFYNKRRHTYLESR